MKPGYSWKITRATNLRKWNALNPLNAEITFEEWKEFVEQDPSFTWYTETPLCILDRNDAKFEGRRYRKALYNYDILNNSCLMEFGFSEGIIIAYIAPKTQKKLKKVFEVADYFNAKVYKLYKEMKREEELK